MESEQWETPFDQQREWIMSRIGRLGGKPTRKERIVNFLFVIAVVSCFVASLLTTGIFRLAAIEIGLLLLSLKFAYFLHNQMRINHFQFWILISIEGRLNELVKDTRENNGKLSEMTAMLTEIKKGG